jgi:hypothetical protein
MPPVSSTVVNSIADLRSVSASDAVHALVTGYFQAGDGGGGAFALDVDDVTTADNGGTVIVAADGGRWRLIHDGRISIRQFGAKVDGVTSDEAAVQAAINAGSHVWFPPGVCKINATVVLHSHLCIELAPDAIIDASSAGDFLFFASGALGAYVPLTATAAAGSRTIEVDSTSGFAQRDWIKIKSETLFETTTAPESNARLGEINRIEEDYAVISGDELTPTTIPLAAALQSTYLVDKEAAVAKVTPIENISIHGGTLRGNPSDNNAQAAIFFSYSLNCRVDNVTIEQFDRNGVGSNNSVNTSVTACRFHNMRARSTGYGISFSDATADSLAAGNHFDEVRHAITTTAGGSGAHGIPRRILFSHNTVRNSSPSLETAAGGDAIDTHPPGEDISIVGNTVLSSSGIGINVECPKALIIGNTINDAGAGGIRVHNESDLNGSIVVANNRIERCAGIGIAVEQGSRPTPTGRPAAFTEVVVEGNSIRAANVGIRVKLTNEDPIVLRDVSVVGNSIRDTKLEGIVLDGIRCGTISNNALSKVAGIGIRAFGLDDVSIASNSLVIESSSDAGIHIQGGVTGASERCSIVGNTIAVNSGTSRAPSIKFIDVNRAVVVANVQRGTAGLDLGEGTGIVSANNI